ncbi:hypothetical protein ACFVR1_03375 [Psychrobacillus sp. NPDC058041]|uniref:hypothetical protein n=1 Tax=Psychrobacillus sp. NPDC058041 TaxID=3346310 RepID=UPI0036DC67AB
MRLSYTLIFISCSISIIVGCLVFFYLPLFKFDGFEKALEGVLLLSSISLGFYGACLSVLASIFNTKIVKEIMEDGNYRSEFIIVSILALISGFLTVLTTIVYQVLLENGTVVFVAMNIVNSIWIALFILFLSFSLLFVLISFLIFFKNTEVIDSTNVHSGQVQNPEF